MEIDQDELNKAIVRLTEEPPEESSDVFYQNPLEVAREEWRKRSYGNISVGLKPEVIANLPKPDALKQPPPLYSVAASDEESFNEAVRTAQEAVSESKNGA